MSRFWKIFVITWVNKPRIKQNSQKAAEQLCPRGPGSLVSLPLAQVGGLGAGREPWGPALGGSSLCRVKAKPPFSDERPDKRLSRSYHSSLGGAFRTCPGGSESPLASVSAVPAPRHDPRLAPSETRPEGLSESRLLGASGRQQSAQLHVSLPLSLLIC